MTPHFVLPAIISINFFSHCLFDFDKIIHSLKVSCCYFFSRPEFVFDFSIRHILYSRYRSNSEHRCGGLQHPFAKMPFSFDAREHYIIKEMTLKFSFSTRKINSPYIALAYGLGPAPRYIYTHSRLGEPQQHYKFIFMKIQES